MKKLIIIFFQLTFILSYAIDIDSLRLTTSKEKNLYIKNNNFLKISQVLWQNGYLDSAEIYADSSLSLANKLNNDSLKCLSLINLGVLNAQNSSENKAINYFFKALKLSELNNFEILIASSCNGLGLIYENRNEPDKSLQYHNRALAIFTKYKIKPRIASSLSNLGNVYIIMKQYEKALNCFTNAVTIKESINDTLNMHYAIMVENIGLLLLEQFDYKKSLPYLQKSKRIKSLIGDVQGEAYLYLTLSAYYSKNKQYDLAKKCVTKSIQLSKKYNLVYVKQTAFNTAATIDTTVGDYKSAVYNLLKFISITDTIFNSENDKISQELEKQYLTEKKDNEIKLLNKEKEIVNSELKKNYIISLSLAIGALLILIFSYIIFKRLQLTKKQKIIIQEINEELNQTNEEILAQRDALEVQKQKIEDAHVEIKDSIVYAKRIQNAILPASKIIKQLLPESFVLYKPKDVVAGDFYWIEKSGNTILFAAADCTGHGVPGAMVSVVCNNALNRSVREFKLIDPGKILDKTREIVLEEFSKSEENVQDGMDIALCALNGNTVHFAGAHNPLWINRNNEIIEIKANKQPIGKFDKVIPFTTNTFELHKNDVLYVFTDGYTDQFGGEKDKKFSTRQLKELLLEIHQLPMKEQKEVLNSTIENWIKLAKTDQLDDICIFGIKI